MPARRFLSLLVLCCVLCSSLIACDIFPDITTTDRSATPGPTDENALNTWQRLSPGMEIRREHWKVSDAGNEDTVTIARFDLSQVHISIGYQPSNPLFLANWANNSHALAVINGGYFDQKNRTTSLTVANGQSYGTSYTGFGGMLSVDSNGHASLRSLRQQPYNADTEQLQQATQSSPMLMIDGKRTDFDANAASQRRSVVAIDKQGRLLLIASPSNAFSLDDLADLLVHSDLSIQNALNLDGGASTGLAIKKGAQETLTIDSLTPLPIVIMIK